MGEKVIRMKISDAAVALEKGRLLVLDDELVAHTIMVGGFLEVLADHQEKMLEEIAKKSEEATQAQADKVEGLAKPLAVSVEAVEQAQALTRKTMQNIKPFREEMAALRKLVNEIVDRQRTVEQAFEERVSRFKSWQETSEQVHEKRVDDQLKSVLSELHKLREEVLEVRGNPERLDRRVRQAEEKAELVSRNLNLLAAGKRMAEDAPA